MKKQIVLMLVFALAASASAGVVGSYDSGVVAAAGSAGAADPTTQGWTASPGIGPGTNAWAHAYDSGDGGWRTVDGTNSTNAYYQYDIAAGDASDMAFGWTATWTLSMDSDAINGTGGFVDDYYLPPNNDRQSSIYAWIETVNSDSYVLAHKIDENSNLLIDDGTAIHQMTTDGSAYDNFKTFTLNSDGTSATLTLGTTTVALNGHSFHAADRVVFGSGSTPLQGSAIWNQIGVTATIPEPATMVLLGVGSLVAIRRKK